MSERETAKPPSLLQAAEAVMAAWRDYLEDEGQLMPRKLVDDYTIMEGLEAAIEAEKAKGEAVPR